MGSVTRAHAFREERLDLMRERRERGGPRNKTVLVTKLFCAGDEIEPQHEGSMIAPGRELRLYH